MLGFQHWHPFTLISRGEKKKKRKVIPPGALYILKACPTQGTPSEIGVFFFFLEKKKGKQK